MPKVDSHYRQQFRKLLDKILADLEDNQDIEITTVREKVIAYIANELAKSEFMRTVSTGGGDKVFGDGWAQG